MAIVNPLPTYFYEPVDAGYINCPLTLRYPNARPGTIPYCDASAAIYHAETKTLVFAADWWGSNYHFPFMHLNWDNRKAAGNVAFQLKPRIRYNAAGHMAKQIVEKVEDMSKTASGRFTMATGSFTHYPESYDKWQRINRVVYWEDTLPEKLMIPDIRHNGVVIEAGNNNGNRISEILRTSIQSAIQKQYPNAEYFKIEGLAFAPENRVIFGVREIGENYENAKIASLLVTTNYSEDNSKLTLDTDFQITLNYELLAAEHNISETIGISSLEFDFKMNRLLMTTSFEHGRSFDQIGAYLWVTEYGNVSGQLADPILVQNEDSSPLRFSHKIEAMTLDDKGRVILISDDDKVTGHVIYDFPGNSTVTPGPQSTYRQANQAHYNIINLKNRRD